MYLQVRIEFGDKLRQCVTSCALFSLLTKTTNSCSIVRTVNNSGLVASDVETRLNSFFRGCRPRRNQCRASACTRRKHVKRILYIIIYFGAPLERMAERRPQLVNHNDALISAAYTESWPPAEIFPRGAKPLHLPASSFLLTFLVCHFPTFVYIPVFAFSRGQELVLLAGTCASGGPRTLFWGPHASR